MRIRTFATLSLISLLLSGCASESNEADAPAPASSLPTSTTVSPSSDTELESPDSETGSRDEEDTASSTTDETEAGSATEATGEDEDGKVLQLDDAGRTLVLADFMRPEENWKQNRYSIASKADVTGIGNEISSCGDSFPESLELRLANNFQKLEFSVGQDNLSEVTDQNLVVRVMGNNKELEVYRVPFNTHQTFNVDVEDVNAFQIEAFLDDEVESCGGSVGAVFYEMKLQ